MAIALGMGMLLALTRSGAGRDGAGYESRGRRCGPIVIVGGWNGRAFLPGRGAGGGNWWRAGRRVVLMTDARSGALSSRGV